MTRDPLRYRSSRLVLSILGLVYDADEPIPWLEACDLLTDGEHTWKTVEATIYDLIAFGALHRIGKPGDRRRPDTRALKPTPLGRAWLDGELVARPGQPRSDDDPDLDAIAEADRLAEALGEAFLDPPE